MATRLSRPSARPLALLALAWAAAVAASWWLPRAAGLDPARGWLALLGLQGVAAGLAVALALAALRRRVDLSRALFAASHLPLLWALGALIWLAALLVLAS